MATAAAAPSMMAFVPVSVSAPAATSTPWSRPNSSGPGIASSQQEALGSAKTGAAAGVAATSAAFAVAALSRRNRRRAPNMKIMLSAQANPFTALPKRFTADAGAKAAAAATTVLTSDADGRDRFAAAAAPKARKTAKGFEGSAAMEASALAFAARKAAAAKKPKARVSGSGFEADDDDDDSDEDEPNRFNDPDWVDPIDRTDWQEVFAATETVRINPETGGREFLCKDGASGGWVPEEKCGNYRYIDSGYESKDENGNWVNWAQMPQDTSHLSDAQRERLIRELKGDIKVSIKDGDDELEVFRPLPEVPPIEKWPFYKAKVKPEYFLTREDAEKEYRVLSMTENVGQAYYLSGRWKLAMEARRHLGYNVNDELDDVANLNSTVLALRAVYEQLKRLGKYNRSMKVEGAEEFEAPSDAARLEALRVDGFLGTEGGSAILLWYFMPSRKRIKIDACVGDDCMDRGPHAEEQLMKYIFREAAELGAEEVWCRTRRTESGKIFRPRYFPQFGFEKLPPEMLDEEEWETIGGLEIKEDAVEFVGGLSLWLSTRKLEKYLPSANEWCQEMGATEILEVAENKKDLCEYLKLEGKEAERLMQF